MTHFSSATLRTFQPPFTEISVAGNLGEAGLELEVVETASGKNTIVTPQVSPGNSWKNVYVKAPQGEFKMVARDKSPTGWFAFKAPREMGWLSYWAMRFLGTANFFFFAGILSFLTALIGARIGKQPSILRNNR